MQTGICVKVMGKVNDLICFPALSRALHVLQKREEKGSDLMGSALTLWMKCSMSSTKALCRKPCLFYSYEYDKPSDLLAAIPVNPSQAACCPHRCLDIRYRYSATFLLLPSPAPIVYGQDGLVGLTYTWEIPSTSWDKIKKQQIKAIKHQFCSEGSITDSGFKCPSNPGMGCHSALTGKELTLPCNTAAAPAWVTLCQQHRYPGILVGM